MARARASDARFAPMPNRALWDRRLTSQDIRNLAVVCAHDQLSGPRGKGQGAWASHARMAAIAGTEYSRFSVSINRLLECGYLDRERLATDRRKFTYRVIYTAEDSLPSSKEVVCATANDHPEIVCSDPELSHDEQTETTAQYISRSEERDSAEAGKINSSEEARFAARRLSKIEFADNVGGQLAQLERALKAGEKIDCLAAYAWLETIEEDDEHRYWALRLSESVVEAMDEQEYAQLHFSSLPAITPSKKADTSLSGSCSDQPSPSVKAPRGGRLGNAVGSKGR